MRNPVKCVVWDLDNTIWNGVLLEDGDVHLRPQIVETLQTLDARGILHSIASKNNHDDAINKLSDLGIDQYFLYPQINWNAKSSSVAAIQQHLNIGMDTLLFLDDQEFERREVESVHPEVRCWDASRHRDLIAHPSLQPRFITEDSSRRRHMYIEEMHRKKEEKRFEGPREEFLADLNMRFEISLAKAEDLQRAEELTVRTNQLNATGRTYSIDELDGFRRSDRHRLLVGELSDRFGSYGKIGLALIEMNDEHWYLRLLLVSCRVISRGLGTILLSYILNDAKQHGKTRVLADFVQTGRNRMMYIAYRFANFRDLRSERGGLVVMENDLSVIQSYPPYVTLVLPKAQSKS